MTSGFNNSIVAGSNNLIRAAIQSPNYVPGVSGWTVKKDGTVEFNSGTFRGTVVAGQFQGSQFIMNNSGLFFYSGTPAAGNLIAAFAPTAGTDSFGNAYVQGLLVADPASMVFPSGATNERTAAQMLASIGVPHAGAQFSALQIFGGSMTTAGAKDLVYIQFSSGDDDDTSDANLIFRYVDNAGVSHQHAYMDSTGFNIVTGSVPGGGGGGTTPDTSYSDFTLRTVTATGVTTQLGSTFTFAAGDNTATTVYEYQAWGNGTWGSTQQQLNVAYSITGNPGTSNGILNTTFPASTAFNWHMHYWFSQLPVNSAGSMNGTWEMNVSANTAAAQAGTSMLRTFTGASIDTSAAFSFGMNAGWASTTGGPTLTHRGSMLTRHGN